MDKKTLEALKGSIRKWEDIVNGTGTDRGYENCPLCALFRHIHDESDDDEGHSGSCDGCPIFERTGYVFCNETPYDEYSYPNEPSSMKKKKEAAIAELNFLKSLLPRKEKICPKCAVFVKKKKQED